jgi:FKBP-type peptidyl-prolyl cis-trans isomerase FklB
MKLICLTSLFVASMALSVAEAQERPAAAAPPSTIQEQTSYVIGLNIGNDLKQQGVEINVNMLARGIADALAGKEPALSEPQIEAAFAELRKIMTAKQEQEMAQAQKKGEVNKQQGAAFLAANKSKPGVKTTASGLQYKVLKAGNGPTPKTTDKVRTHYHGTLIDGTVFDSSVQRGEPAEFPVGGVIRGWTEALQLMKVGDKWQLFIPSELAYGPRGAGGVIGPNATLIFEIELLEILK